MMKNADSKRWVYMLAYYLRRISSTEPHFYQATQSLAMFVCSHCSLASLRPLHYTRFATPTLLRQLLYARFATLASLGSTRLLPYALFAALRSRARSLTSLTPSWDH